MELNSEMLAAIKLILAANPNCALTGGNGLLLQKKNIRRQPTDIDIYCPDGVFKIIPGMSMPEIKDGEKDTEYADEVTGGTRTAYLFKGFKIDVFSDESETKQLTRKVDGVKVCYPQETLAAKFHYFEANGSTKSKHKLDMVFYLLMN